MVSLALKALAGALVVLLIAALSGTRNFYVAGLVPLFPTFTLIAHAIVGARRPPADLRRTALFGLWSMLPFGLYMLVVFWLSTRCSLARTLVAATAAWVGAAGLLLVVWQRVYPSGI